MKYGKILGIIALVIVTAASGLTAQTTFEKVRDQLKEIYTKKNADGTVRVAKQFERWNWFWEPRVTADGEFGSPMHYLNELNKIKSRKTNDAVQEIPLWEEIGPIAPNLPGRNNVWSGIGRVNAIAVSPKDADDLFLGSAQGGIWKTTNGGSNWSFIEIPEMPMFGVSDIAVSTKNPDVIYVATGDVNASIPGELSGFPGFSYGIIKSTDNGQTWERTGLEYIPSQNNLVSRLWVDPRDENIIVAATYTGILKSTDGGENWRGVSSTLAFRDLIGNPVTFDVLYASTFSFNGGAAVYRSTDVGESWEPVLTVGAANRFRIAVTEAQPEMVGVVASRANTNGLEDVYRSTDYGKTWAAMNVEQNLLGWSSTGNDHSRGGQGFYDLAMAISHESPADWIVGGVNAWRSTNRGATWELAAHWTGSRAPWVHADHHFQYYHPQTGRLYTCNDGGVSYSDDLGDTWRDMSRGLKIQQYYGLATTNLRPSYTLAGSQDNGTARTLDGDQFAHVLGGDGMATAIDSKNADVVYASQPYGQFFRSDNAGNNFRLIANGNIIGEPRGGWVSPIETDPNRSLTVYIGYTQLYKSTNGGANWSRLTEVSASSYMRTIAVAPSNSNYIYIGYSNDAYYTTNGGGSWEKINGISAFIQDIIVHPTDPSRAFISFGGFSPSAKVFEINDGQITNLTKAGLPNVPANALVYQPGVLNRLYVGTDEGVFFLDEDTEVWEPYGRGMPTTMISDMELIEPSNTLRVSTYGRGIWEVEAIQCLADAPSVSVSGPEAACQGDTITLVASDGYDRYIWSNGQSGQTIKLFNFTQTGEYTVNVVDNDGCRATSDAVSITINRSPPRPNISLRDGTTLRSTAIGGVEMFQWYLNGEEIPGATEREFTPTFGGEYTVLVTNSEGCSTLSNPFEYEGEPSSVDENGQGNLLTVRPNPFETSFTVELPDGLARSIEIVDMTGTIVFTEQTAPGQTNAEVNVAGLATGVYVVRVNGNAGVWSTTVIKR